MVPVPYLPGHEYALLPGADNGLLDIKYSATVPDCTQNFRYLFSFGFPEVLDFIAKFSELYLVFQDSISPDQLLTKPSVATSNRFSIFEDMPEVRKYI